MWPMKQVVTELPIETKCCGNCHYEKNLKRPINAYPCKTCDSSIIPPPYWKDYRLVES